MRRYDMGMIANFLGNVLKDIKKTKKSNDPDVKNLEKKLTKKADELESLIDDYNKKWNSKKK